MLCTQDGICMDLHVLIISGYFMTTSVTYFVNGHALFGTLFTVRRKGKRRYLKEIEFTGENSVELANNNVGSKSI